MQQAATRVAFFVVGVVMAAWAPMVPLVKERLALDDRELGLLLLCIGLGSVICMPVAGGLASRYGCRKVILAASTVAFAAFPVMAASPTTLPLAIALFLFGAGAGTVDVVMNIQAVIVEKDAGKPMMSGFHGLFSVGGIVGAGGATLLLASGIPPLIAAFIIVGASMALLWSFARGLLSYATKDPTPAVALPRGRVLLIGSLCFILFLAEGSVLDWSGVLLTTVQHLPESRAGLGYVAFAAAMTLGRLTGDIVVHRFGGRRMLIFGGLFAAFGFALAALSDNWIASIAGFAMVGIGAANVVPILFTAAGRQQSMPANLAISAVTTLGYAGILAGPALLGFVAHATSLPLALLLVSGLLALVALSAPSVTRSEAN